MMLAPWKKSYNQPRQHIKNQGHYFAKKVHLVKYMVFPVVMYGCESWTKGPSSQSYGFSSMDVRAVRKEG